MSKRRAATEAAAAVEAIGDDDADNVIVDEEVAAVGGRASKRTKRENGADDEADNDVTPPKSNSPPATTKKKPPAKKGRGGKKATGKKKASGDANEAEEEEEEGDVRMADSSGPSVVTSSPPGPAYIARCDNNSLSVVLSFLSSADFLSSTRVSRQWHAVSSLNTAWPSVHLHTLIERLRQDNYDDPAQRRLRVLQSDIGRVVQSTLWKKANDVELILDDPQVDRRMIPIHTEEEARAASQRLEDASYLELPKLLHLTALNLTWRNASDAAVAGLIAALAPRLQVFILSDSPAPPPLYYRSAFFSSIPAVGGLHNLRVLVTDVDVPPIALRQLERLEFLHLHSPHAIFTTALARTTRYLSTKHALTTFHTRTCRLASIRCFVDSLEEAAKLTALHLAHPLLFPSSSPPLGPIEDLPPAAFHELAITGLWPIHDFANLAALAAMPNLHRLSLTINVGILFCDQFRASHFAPSVCELLARLTDLQLEITRNGPSIAYDIFSTRSPTSLFTSLQHCTNLKSLRITTVERAKVAIASVEVFTPPEVHLDLFLSSHSGLEQLTLGLNVNPAESSWHHLSRCPQLTRLDLGQRPSINLAVLAPHLGLLPAFKSLEMTVWPQESAQKGRRHRFTFHPR